RTRLERAQIHGARMSFHLTLGQLAEVVRCGLRALSLLGVEIPEAAEARGALLERELGELRAYLSDHEVTELLALPVVTDPEEQLVLQLLADLTLPATSLRIPALGALALIKQLNLARARGTSSASAY